MQISRHWRMNAQRYRLEGVRYNSGEVSLQERPVTVANDTQPEQTETDTRETETVHAA